MFTLVLCDSIVCMVVLIIQTNINIGYFPVYVRCVFSIVTNQKWPNSKIISFFRWSRRRWRFFVAAKQFRLVERQSPRCYKRFCVWSTYVNVQKVVARLFWRQSLATYTAKKSGPTTKRKIAKAGLNDQVSHIARFSSLINNLFRRFKSFHVNHRALPLPNVDVSKATAELLRHLSRKSPRLFRPSASPSSTNSVPVTTTTNHVEKQPVRKKLSYTSGDVKITRPYGLARRKSESYASSVRVKHRGTFRLSDVGPVRILNNHNRQKKPSPSKSKDPEWFY